MKCPYKNFNECIVEKCPACNYKENNQKVIEGKYPYDMNEEEAVNQGLAWESTKTTYKFVSCKLIESGVQPISQKKEIINNKNSTRINIRKSIF